MVFRDTRLYEVGQWALAALLGVALLHTTEFFFNKQGIIDQIVLFKRVDLNPMTPSEWNRLKELENKETLTKDEGEELIKLEQQRIEFHKSRNAALSLAANINRLLSIVIGMILLALSLYFSTPFLNLLFSFVGSLFIVLPIHVHLWLVAPIACAAILLWYLSTKNIHQTHPYRYIAFQMLAAVLIVTTVSAGIYTLYLPLRASIAQTDKQHAPSEQTDILLNDDSDSLPLVIEADTSIWPTPWKAGIFELLIALLCIAIACVIAYPLFVQITSITLGLYFLLKYVLTFFDSSLFPLHIVIALSLCAFLLYRLYHQPRSTAV